MATRLNSYLKDADFTELFQSPYKVGHCTETALIRVQNGTLRAIDDGQCVILVLLDLSAAFDTVDHIKSLWTDTMTSTTSPIDYQNTWIYA